MSDLPRTIDQLRPKKLDAFKAWLVSHGSEVLATSNAWEVMRFRGAKNIAVIYQNRNGRLNWQNGADDAWLAFADGKPWQANVRRSKRRKTDHQIEALIDRDGEECFFCGGDFEDSGDMALSLEHMLSIAHGGTNHLSNLVLAHVGCNRKADHMSVAEKVRLRDEMRAKS